ncbi:maltose excess protein 1-like, chloroplastic isoform X1 [Canna indica]|uniref:Maltose excess protein 1-like, chloroplastic isoform X1 n=1 Tax=Canna indica TaxID=4628 RepID=A0AAQ3Q757_9LILI|nr:maltose excess protein 1-like, chloroplastic isoform X1 [Canna indica]
MPLSFAPSLSISPHHLHLLAPLNRPFSPLRTRSVLLFRRRSPPSPVVASARPPPASSSDEASRFQQWDSLTARFAGASNIPFLLIQIPQILLNYRNLVSGNEASLLAVPWLGMLTGLLGNMTLLSYFIKKKETEAIVVQTLGVVSIYVVLGQLAMAEAMSLPYFTAISLLVVLGLLLNFMNYFGRLHEGVWQVWVDFITVAGISVLPQVMWSTFVPFVPKSTLPGILSCIIAVDAIILARLNKLPDRMVKFIRSISGWTATLLFMWMPIAQMWTTYLNPDNIRGLSAFTILLGMIGNGLMIPRALFIRDLMWFVGASWASYLHGWGNLACMYYFKSISWKFFLVATLSLFIWTGIALWRDTKVYGHSSPVKSLQELLSET